MEKIIIGYKCVNNNNTNRYGTKILEGKTYTVDDQNKEIIFGINGYGFHFCQNLEDTLRYFDAMKNEVKIYQVKGFGKIIESEDEYNGFYNLYVASSIEILKELTRTEIINYGLNLNHERVKRFISLFKLTNDEINLFKEKFIKYQLINQYIEYYQLDNKNAFKPITKILTK